jgi:hypothetical protein
MLTDRAPSGAIWKPHVCPARACAISNEPSAANASASPSIKTIFSSRLRTVTFCPAVQKRSITASGVGDAFIDVLSVPNAVVQPERVSRAIG